MNTPSGLIRRMVHRELLELIRESIRSLDFDEASAPKRADRPVQHEPAYKGDTLSKKCVRLRVWELVQSILGDNFQLGKHLFLASHIGGDASVLHGLRVPYSNMVAVDSDKSAARDFIEKYPDIPIHTADVLNVLEVYARTGGSLDSIYLDFTSQLSDHTLERALLAAKTVREGGVVACTFATGREKQTEWKGSAPRFRALEEHLGSKSGRSITVLARLKHSSSSERGPGSHMCTLVVGVGSVSYNWVSQGSEYKVGLYDLYRDIQRLADHPRLSCLLNSSEYATQALLQRVKSYPPPPA